MKLSDYDYILPKESIALYPTPDRGACKLISVDRKSGNFKHTHFRDLLSHLNPGDLLVLNDTKVLPARLFGKKDTGGKVEALLLKEREDGVWEALLRPGGRIREGMKITFAENGKKIQAQVCNSGVPNSGIRQLRFNLGARDRSSLKEIINEIGHIPLPPYLNRPDSSIDREMYQTVFAKNPGAVAAPTAGLHFDEALLQEISEKGIEIVYLTLHVSYGTFQPLPEEKDLPEELYPETYEITEEAARKINQAKKEGRRVIACGTTVVRALESAATVILRPEAEESQKEILRFAQNDKETRLFIHPPYEFKIIDGLITNFHLPKSSLLMLVAAWLGREKLMPIYEEAIREKYRFYSYGDAMFIS